MYQYNKVLALVFVFSLFGAWGQVSLNAPYSSEGIGQVNNTGLTFQQGMSGLGVSNSSVQFINLINPALLARTRYTVMEVGANSTTHLLQEEGGSQSTTSANLSNLTFSFPIGKYWSSSFGISPYSTVNYQTTETAVIDAEANAIQSNSGNGGISKLHFSNGVQIYKDSTHKIQTYLGLEASYLFGSIDRVSRVQLEESTGVLPYYTDLISKYHYSDVVFKPAFAIRKEFRVKKVQKRKTLTYKRNRPYYDKDTLETALYPNAKQIIITEGIDTVAIAGKASNGKIKYYLKEEIVEKGQKVRIYEPISEKKYLTATRTRILKDTLVYVEKMFRSDSLNKGSGVFMNLGAVYEIGSSVGTNYSSSVERYNLVGSVLGTDTVAELSGNTTLPSSLKVGLSFDKPIPAGKTAEGALKTTTWSVGADFHYTQWSQYKSVLGTQNLQDSYKIILGGEVTPNMLSNRFFKRTIYRMGLSYATLPHVFSESAQDVGISFGMSMPVGPFNRKRLPRYINLSLVYGQRGDFNNKLIKEHYFATTLSFTVNSKWFQRYKVGL
ncbi:MAG: hypothetical protein GY827_07295 [Cytophagales bacterium]|nr:hypothetical protein [Cytophagales bacterium]